MGKKKWALMASAERNVANQLKQQIAAVANLVMLL
jgi:hypothetical protein